jgi:hypothetical protein
MKKASLFVLLGTVALSACLVGETTHTLYLEPDGRVTWTVLEKDVRSNTENMQGRRQEEEDYITRATQADHPVSRALCYLDPEALEAKVLRSNRPYTVFTEARFENPELLARSLLDELHITGDVQLEMWGELRRLTLILNFEETEEDIELEDETILALVDDLEDYRIVLPQGQFVEAVGFQISDDGAVATPIEWDEEEATDGGRLVYSLTWEIGSEPEQE